MSDGQTQSNTQNGTSTVWQIIGRLVAAAVVLAITAFFTPGFAINNIWSLPTLCAVRMPPVWNMTTPMRGARSSWRTHRRWRSQ